ncbi:Uncharacterised protein [Salmonella enterica subsp. enterica serovar Bovismorbificans]|uniref:Uncharacterized protein n=1 Tax=Salmonella enterica subsp. enterica serovar Bovismorbificans TaxID=58097 RepID=A0A655C9A8_SALET|nr:Uncharacterised protein [Salmonella enterica subsp. enterica serovar Bovismorbificans]
MGLRGLQQPVQKSLMLRGAAFTVEVLSQMPVRGVEDAHNCSMQKKRERDYTRHPFHFWAQFTAGTR